MQRRPILFAVVASAALVLGTWAGPVASAAADPSPLTFSVDKALAHSGETVTLTLTFTNPEAVPVTFSYLSVNPTFGTWYYGMKYSITGCSGEVTSCWLSAAPSMAAFMNPSPPIAPGASRTVTITYDVALDTLCGGGRSIAFFFYTYRESTAGFVGQVVNGPGTIIDC